MITHVQEHRPKGSSYASGGEPGWTDIRWDCDGGCGLVGLEWDDDPYRADGQRLNDIPDEGDEAYCKECRDARTAEEHED